MLATFQPSNIVVVCNGQVEALAGHSAISYLSVSWVNATWPGELLTANASIWSKTFYIFTQNSPSSSNPHPMY